MKTRRGLSPVLSTVILVAVGIALGGFVSVLYSETAHSYVEVDALQYTYTYCETVDDIENVRWIVHFEMLNRGTQQTEISLIFVNEQPIDVYGLTEETRLEDAGHIGSDLPEDGLWLKSGESAEILLYIGEDLFSSGTVLTFRVNMKSNIHQDKKVILG